METKMTATARRELTVTHIAHQPSDAFTPQLICYGPATEGEWEDTDALFNMSVLNLYPTVPTPPAGTRYIGVGYGSLVACDSNRSQIAYLEGAAWHV